MNKILGIALIVLAIGLAVIPTFTDCQSQGKSLTTDAGKSVPMKCHWTGLAEVGVAVPMALAGVMMTINRRKSNLLGMGILGAASGAMAIAFPIGLIGVCATPTMLCHTAMSPALITMGSVAVAGSLGALVLSRKVQD